MHADRTNRVILVMFALLLIASGLIGALTSVGVFGTAAEHSRLMANPVGFYIGRHGAWLWPVIAAAAAMLALLALRWLTVLLFSTDRVGHVKISAGSAGRTTLIATALTDAVTEEIKTYPGVHSAKARLIGEPASPELVLEVSFDQNADPSALRRRIEDGAVAHSRQAVDDPHLPVILELSVSDRRRRNLS